MNVQSIKGYLVEHEFFSGFSDDVLNFLCNHSNSYGIKKDLALFRQGEKADKFYVVRNGLMSIQMPAIMGPNLDIQTLGNGQVLGWSWLISPYKWNFQAVARQDTELLMFDGVAILAKCEQDSKFGYEMMRKFAELMSVRLDAARRKLMEEWNPAGFA
jgi:CRP/FNR family transcriptional regulator, cyclic AMP receptor protein